MRKVNEDQLAKIDAANLNGVSYVREQTRSYPEKGLGGHIFGFIGSDENGNLAGRYGIEGYFNEELSGERGFLEGERDSEGRIIAVADVQLQKAVDGADILLTVDRTIQFTVCQKVRAAVLKHGADSGSAVVLDPYTGAVLAMCGHPDFDPDRYSEAATIGL